MTGLSGFVVAEFSPVTNSGNIERLRRARILEEEPSDGAGQVGRRRKESTLGLQPPPEKMVGVGLGGLTTF